MRLLVALLLASNIVFIVLWALQIGRKPTSERVVHTPMQTSQGLRVMPTEYRQMFEAQSTHQCLDNPFDRIDVVYYINLATATDRREEIERELLKVLPDLSKVRRIEAVRHELGSLGCSLSHIKALEHFIASGLETCLVLEDDFTFKLSKVETFDLMNRFASLNIRYDVLLLGCDMKSHEESSVDFLLRTRKANSTASYIVGSKYAPKLLENFRGGATKVAEAGKRVAKYALDMYWHRLMANDRWYTFAPIIGHQRDHISTTGKGQHFKTYPDKYEVERFVPMYEYIDVIFDSHLGTYVKQPNRSALHLYVRYRDTIPTSEWDLESDSVMVATPKQASESVKFLCAMKWLMGAVHVNQCCRNVKGLRLHVGDDWASADSEAQPVETTWSSNGLPTTFTWNDKLIDSPCVSLDGTYIERRDWHLLIDERFYRPLPCNDVQIVQGELWIYPELSLAQAASRRADAETNVSSRLEHVPEPVETA